jgi:hypothetical protein
MALFGKKPYPAERRSEVDRLIDDLIQIGKTEDYLSEVPGGAFNNQCRHVHAREIGQRLHDIGGVALMQYAMDRVHHKLGANLSAHLEYAWTEIGEWLA